MAKSGGKEIHQVGHQNLAYGETDVIIHSGILYLCTQVGFYKVYLETDLATNHLFWKNLIPVPEKCHSNLTIFNGHTGFHCYTSQ